MIVHFYVQTLTQHPFPVNDYNCKHENIKKIHGNTFGIHIRYPLLKNMLGTASNLDIRCMLRILSLWNVSTIQSTAFLQSL